MQLNYYRAVARLTLETRRKAAKTTSLFKQDKGHWSRNYGTMSTREYTGQFTWQCSPASADNATNPGEGGSPTCRVPRCQRTVSLSGSTPAHMGSYFASSFPIPDYNLIWNTRELALFWWSILWKNGKKCCRNVRKVHFLHALEEQKCRANIFVLPVTYIFLQFVWYSLF